MGCACANEHKITAGISNSVRPKRYMLSEVSEIITQTKSNPNTEFPREKIINVSYITIEPFTFHLCTL